MKSRKLILTIAACGLISFVSFGQSKEKAKKEKQKTELNAEKVKSGNQVEEKQAIQEKTPQTGEQNIQAQPKRQPSEKKEIKNKHFQKKK